MRRAIENAIESGLRVRREEQHRTALMFFYQLAIVSAFIVGRTVRDALFLSRYPLDRLPLMYVTVAVVVSIASLTWSRIAERGRRDVMITRTLAGASAVLVLTYGLLAADAAGHWLYPSLYVFVEVYGAISMIQFWTYANEIFSSREAKRLFALIGAGGVVASVVCGFAVGSAARGLGAEALVLTAGLFLALGALIVRRLGKVAGRTAVGGARATTKDERKAARRSVLDNKHLRLIAGIVCLTMLTTTLVDYQFKVIARESYAGDENGLAAYFGYFYGFAGLLSCGVQFFAIGRLLERAGIAIALLVLPIGLLTGVSSLLLATFTSAMPALVASTLAKGAENVFRYTVNDATMQLLYVPVAAKLRARAKALIDGVIKPVSVGVSGLAILGLTRAFGGAGMARDLAWLDLVLITAWIGLVLGIRKEYVRSLIGTLRTRRLDFDSPFSVVADESTVRVLGKALASEHEMEALHALELVPTVRPDLGPVLGAAIAQAVSHGSPEVRIRALELLGRSGKFEHLEPIRSRFTDVDARVRAAAVRAFCALGRDRTFREATGFLRDRSPVVRGAAVSGLFDHGGLDGVLAAAETLKTLLASRDTLARVEGARVLEGARVRNFYAPVLVLLQDPVLEVRLAAVRAAGAMRAEALGPPLVYLLAQPRVARAASGALAAYGAEAEPLLVTVLAHTREAPVIRRQVPRILARIGGEASMAALTAALGDADHLVVAEAAKSIARLKSRRPELVVDEARIVAATRGEIHAAYQALATLVDLALPEGGLLGEALALRHERRLSVAFRLLSIRYPTRTIELVYRNLESDNKAMRANAVELVDNLLPREESRLVLPLLEAHSLAERVAAGAELFPLERRAAEAWLRALVVDADAWVATTALHHVSEVGPAEVLGEAIAREGRWDPLVLEATCHALSRAWSPSLGVPEARALELVERATLEGGLAGQSAAEALRAAVRPGV